MPFAITILCICNLKGSQLSSIIPNRRRLQIKIFYESGILTERLLNDFEMKRLHRLQQCLRELSHSKIHFIHSIGVIINVRYASSNEHFHNTTALQKYITTFLILRVCCPLIAAGRQQKVFFCKLFLL